MREIFWKSAGPEWVSELDSVCFVYFVQGQIFSPHISEELLYKAIYSVLSILLCLMAIDILCMSTYSLKLANSIVSSRTHML